jgi:hypothetical protein
MASTQKPFLIRGRDPLKFGMKGWDVLAMQRALVRAKVRSNKPGIYFGWRCRAQVKLFQRHVGIMQTGTVNQTTLNHLHKYYDGYGVWLIKHQAQQSKLQQSTSKVQQSVQTAFFLMAHASATHYTEDWNLRMSWFRLKIRPPKFPQYLDCSSACTWYRWVAGLSDPNGFGYNGTGYTGTMLANGTRVTTPQPGDMTFYQNPDHVAIEVGNGRVISDGSEAGPMILPRNYRTVYQTRRYASS